MIRSGDEARITKLLSKVRRGSQAAANEHKEKAFDKDKTKKNSIEHIFLATYLAYLLFIYYSFHICSINMLLTLKRKFLML